ncbi:MAG: protease pro-enzyme activation domain-containing protein, partial [Thermoplasmatales archaeon]
MVRVLKTTTVIFLIFIIITTAFGTAVFVKGEEQPEFQTQIEKVSLSPFIYSYSKMNIVPYAPGSVSSATKGLYKGEMHIMVTFRLSNESRLLSYLSNLSNPYSSQYHRYLSKKAFVADFSPSTAIYNEALNYFSSFPGTSVTTYQDRISIVVNAPAV